MHLSGTTCHLAPLASTKPGWLTSVVTVGHCRDSPGNKLPLCWLFQCSFRNLWWVCCQRDCQGHSQNYTPTFLQSCKMHICSLMQLYRMMLQCSLPFTFLNCHLCRTWHQHRHTLCCVRNIEHMYNSACTAFDMLTSTGAMRELTSSALVLWCGN